MRLAVRLLAFAIILLAGLGGGFFWLFIGVLPTSEFEAPQSPEEAMRQDIIWAKGYADHDRSFSPDERKAYLAYLSGVESQAARLSHADLEFHLAAAVALADNAHTNISPIGRSKRLNRLPVRFHEFSDGFFVVQTTDDYSELLGKRVVGISDYTVDEVADGLATTFGGPDNRRRFMAILPLNSPAFLHAAGFSSVPETLRIQFADQTSIELASLPADPEHATPFGGRLLQHEPRDHEAAAWRSLNYGLQPPISLQNQGDPYVKAWFGGLNLFYVRLNYNYSIEGHDMAAWLKEAEAEMRDHKPRYIVIDLRWNGGGTDITQPLARALPEILPASGELFVITSEETFSAAVGAAAQFKKFAGDRAKVVGTPAGDDLRFWANGGSPWVLPNSGISLPVWRALEDYRDGCWSVLECFWLSPGFMRKGVDTITPDLPAPLTFEDYRGGRDPSWEAILTDIGARPKE